MLKLITILLQIFALNKTFSKSTTAIDFFERSVQTARSYFLFTVGCIIASVFLLVALIVAIIGVGLQIEQQGAISFTGLMISATLFLVISIFFFIVSTIALIVQKQRRLERQKAIEAARAAQSPLGTLFEEILKQILNNLSQPKKTSAEQTAQQSHPS